MFFDKKIERSLDTLKYISDRREGKKEDEVSDLREENEKLELSDVLAIIISALMVYGPIFLIIALIAFLLTL